MAGDNRFPLRLSLLLAAALLALLTAVLLRPGPQPASAASATAVAAGGGHTCAITTGGGLKCWGFNAFGQLGDGTTVGRTTPVDVCASGAGAGCTGGSPLTGVVAVAAGASHTCTITTGGALRCWGDNSQGQLGDGTTAGRTTPVNVTGLTSGVAAVSAGAEHTCALTTAGGLECWGINSQGELGDGTFITPRLTSVNVVGLASGVTAVAAGTANHTCAIKAGGLKCWGRGGSGQLGDGTNINRTTPVDVCATGASAPCGGNLLSGVTAVAGGNGHTCAVSTGGGLKCWGVNSVGQLGDGTNMQRLTPVDVCASGAGAGCSGGSPLTGVAVASGALHSCAVTTAGGLKCWGQGAFAQLGDGMTTNSTNPVDVTGLTSGVTGVAASGNHSCAVTTAGGLKCWGRNVEGQLGDGQACSASQCTTPVDVVGFELLDADGDNIADSEDNCPDTSNTDQFDNDNDGQPGVQPGPNDNFGGDACDPDDDNDGIADAIDDLPLTSSTGFSDGGATSGSVTSGAPEVSDLTDPAGVKISASGGTATVTGSCSPPVNLTLTIGDVADLTCTSASVEVITGPVEATFGTITATLPSGTTATITETSTGVFEVLADAGNTSDIDVGGQTVGAGAQVSVTDTDSDGVVDSADKCPTVATPWLVPVGDDDCDAWSTADENSIGTLPFVACGAGAWPPDIFEDQLVDSQDMVALLPGLFKSVGQDGYNSRLDIFQPGSIIDSQDLVAFLPFLFKSCVLP